MPHLDRTGPSGDGSKKGRKLGLCKETPLEEALMKLGRGLGKKRKAGGGIGKGRRLRNGL